MIVGGVLVTAAATTYGVREYNRVPETAAERTEVAVSYTHLRAHETVLDLVCRLLLVKKKNRTTNYTLLVEVSCH